MRHAQVAVLPAPVHQRIAGTTVKGTDGVSAGNHDPVPGAQFLRLRGSRDRHQSAEA